MAIRLMLAAAVCMAAATPVHADYRVRLYPAVPIVAAPPPPPVIIRPRPDRSLTFAVQNELAWAGYNPGPPDGLFGPRTSFAIQAYQHNNGLPPDGLVSLALLDHLRARRAAAVPVPAVAAAPPPVPGADTSTCREYQRTAKIGGQDVTTTGTACLQKDGTWKSMD